MAPRGQRARRERLPRRRRRCRVVGRRCRAQGRGVAHRDSGGSDLLALAGSEPFLSVTGLRAGYGNMEILHDFTLHVGARPVAVPDRPQWRRQVDCAALGVRLYADFRRRNHGRQRQGQARHHAPDFRSQAQGRARCLYPAGQVGVPEHDGGGEPADGRLPAALPCEGEGGRGARVRKVRPPGRAPQSCGAGAVGRREAPAGDLARAGDGARCAAGRRTVDRPGAALHRYGVRDPARPAARRRQDHPHGRAERQERAGVRRHRLRARLRRDGARRQRRASCCATPTSGACSSAAEARKRKKGPCGPFSPDAYVRIT